MSEKIGVRPVEYKILLRVNDIDRVTPGGLHLPDSAIDREFIAQDSGEIIAMGEMACSESDIWGDNPPKVGDKVIFSKYAGAVIRKMGKQYRLIQDKDLGAVIEGDTDE